MPTRVTIVRYNATVDIRMLSEAELDDFGKLLDRSPASQGCWCMWFIRPVAEYHAAGSAGNRAALTDLLRTSSAPVGLVAADGEDLVGWCAVGPRRRFARMLRSATLRGRDPAEDDDVWLVPCFLVCPERRGAGVASSLLEHAVEVAASAGARAVEGFPLSGSKRRSGGSDYMTGIEPLFAAQGFTDVRRPSSNRVVMRRELRT